jgi:sugar phosphate isomerase/epimerase
MKISTGIFLRDLLAKKRSLIETIIDDNIFEKNSPKDVCKMLKKSGVDGIELLIPNTVVTKDILLAKKILEQSSFPVLSIHQSLPFISATKLSEIHTLCKAAKILNTHVIVLHLEALGKFACNKKYIEDLHMLEKKYDVRFGLENSQKHILSVWHVHTWKQHVFSSFVKKLGFGIVLDTTHLAQTGADIVDFLKENKEEIINIHISDYRKHAFSSTLRPLAYTHLPFGQGDLPLTRFLKLIKKERYQGLITMEIHHVTLQTICTNAKWLKSRLQKLSK